MRTNLWKVDEDHSSLQFSVRHLVVANVRGQFRRWTADLAIDESDLTKSSVSVKIDAASIDTGNSERDAHLRSADFFDVERFPALTFRSRRIESAGADQYRLFGDLTIRDITKEVALDATVAGFVQDPWGGRRTGLSMKASVKRSDFGMVVEGGGVLVGDQVEIHIEIEAVAQALPATARDSIQVEQRK